MPKINRLTNKGRKMLQSDNPMKTATKLNTRLEKMLERAAFDTLLKEGKIFDVQGASQRSGYTPQHIRRLVREGRFTAEEVFSRGMNAEEVQFYFFPEALRKLFRPIQVRK